MLNLMQLLSGSSGNSIFNQSILLQVGAFNERTVLNSTVRSSRTCFHQTVVCKMHVFASLQTCQKFLSSLTTPIKLSHIAIESALASRSLSISQHNTVTVRAFTPTD